jgi:Zn-dependent protease with chaperone function
MIARIFSLYIALFCIVCGTFTFALTTNAPSKAKVYWKGLDESGFRHPLDYDLTTLVRSIPLQGVASTAIRTGLSLVEESVRLQLLSTSVKVSDKQLPELEQSLIEACEILAISPPDLYIQSSSMANAYTLAIITQTDEGESRKPIVVVTSALLDQCTMPEIQAILGHELGHLKCEHSLYLTLGSLISGLISSTLSIRSNLVQDWRLSAEYSCDRAALLVAQDIDVVNGAMVKLYAGTGGNQDLNVEAFIAQSAEYKKLLKKANPLVKYSIQQERRTHPLPVIRVAELKKWAESDSYQKLLKRAAQLGQFMEEKSP